MFCDGVVPRGVIEHTREFLANGSNRWAHGLVERRLVEQGPRPEGAHGEARTHGTNARADRRSQ